MAIARALRSLEDLSSKITDLDNGISLYNKYKTEGHFAVNDFKELLYMSNDLIYRSDEAFNYVRGSGLEDSSLFLPLRVVDHDMKNLATAITSFVWLAHIYSSNESPAYEKLFDDGYSFYEYENLRLSLNVMQYLHSEDKSALLTVPADHIKPLLDSIPRDQSTITVSNPDNIDIPGDMYFALMQCTKNAYKNMLTLKDPSIMEGGISLTIKSSEQGVGYSLKDVGSGISKEVLPEIFGTYTNGGTGVGLQLVNALAKLRSADIFVITGGDSGSYAYANESKAVTSLYGCLSRGTEFYFSTPFSHQ